MMAEQWMEAFCLVTKRLALRAVEGQPGKWKVRENVEERTEEWIMT